MSTAGRLLAISDLHVGYPQNRELVASLRSDSAADWLIVAGDVAELVADVAWVERYEKLVAICRALGVVTPEDPYPVWPGPAGGVVIAPLFLLYDYSFWPAGARSAAEGLALAYESGVMCTDLHPDPHESRQAWCGTRVELTEQRLAALDPGTPVVLVNHYPLVREPLRVLRFPEFALWCGAVRTADWHRRFNAVAVVYGHLHIRRTTWHDGVPFMEVSVGYPREWGRARRTARALPGTFLDFDGAQVVFDPAAGAFVARLSKPRASLVGDSRGELAGRFAVRGGLVVTAIARAPH